VSLAEQKALDPEALTTNVPLEQTYQAAYRGMPAFWRDVLEGRTPEIQ